MRFLKRFKINGMVIYPFILFADKTIDPVVGNHERIHWQQIKRDGVIRFYLSYFYEYLSLRSKGFAHDAAYRGITYEKEAYLHQHDLAYQLSERKKTS